MTSSCRSAHEQHSQAPDRRVVCSTLYHSVEQKHNTCDNALSPQFSRYGPCKIHFRQCIRVLNATTARAEHARICKLCFRHVSIFIRRKIVETSLTMLTKLSSTKTPRDQTSDFVKLHWRGSLTALFHFLAIHHHSLNLLSDQIGLIFVSFNHKYKTDQVRWTHWVGGHWFVPWNIQKATTQLEKHWRRGCLDDTSALSGLSIRGVSRRSAA